MIHVIAVLTTKPGQRDTVLAAVRAVVPAVRAEAGCLEYGPATDLVPAPPGSVAFGADTLVVIEKWESAAALASHSSAPHMAALGREIGGLLASRSIHVLEPA